jgi:hypothetical protein
MNMQQPTLSLTARIIPPLFAVSLGAFATWCQAIAFVGGTIPLFGWQLEGGVLTGFLWVFVTGFLFGIARLTLWILVAGIGKVVPLTIASPSAIDQPPASSSGGDLASFRGAPDGAADGYQATFAAYCAIASQLAYFTNERTQQAMGTLKAGWSIIVERNHRCVLMVYGDCIIVAFRGTVFTEIADWKTNIATTPASVPFGTVHSGYLAALELLWPRLTASLGRMRELNQPLLLTGHSMGAALAVVAAAKFATEGELPLAGLYTFGQPAVGDPAFETELASRLGGKYFRFVNSVDLVPGIFVDPALTTGGQQLFIDRATRIHCGAAASQMAAARLLTQVLEPESRRADVADHAIAEYVRALTSPAPTARSSPGIQGLSPRERMHFWISTALYALLFVAFCVLTWRADGTEAFAMGSGAAFTVMLVALTMSWPQEYNDHLLNWYMRQRLVKS